MSTQSNPVVFVALGEGILSLPMLKAALTDYVQGVEYIEIPKGFLENFDDLWIKGDIGRVWRQFLQNGHNASDVVRVNYVLGTDDEGLLLSKLRPAVEKYFTALYPAGVLSDVYCLMDDKQLLENSDSRWQVMQMLRAEQATGLRVYLLSNLTSLNVFAPDDNIPHTIALLTLFKDCVPDLYVTVPDASRYNDFYFSENCFARHGHFLTASSINLTIPRESLKALLMAELLSYGKDNPLEAEPAMVLFAGEESPTPKPGKSMDYLYGLAIPDVKRDDKLTRRQWLGRLYGQRLEWLVEQLLNENKQETADFSLDISTLDGGNLYDLLRYTGEGGAYEFSAAQAIENAEKDLRLSEEKCTLWLEDMPNFAKNSPEAGRRRLSPLVAQDLWPYVLASDYLRKQTNLQALKEKVAVLSKKRESISLLHHQLVYYADEIAERIAKYSAEADGLNEAFAAFTANAAEYFRRMFNEYADAHRQEISNLSKEMTGYMRRDKLSAYLARLDEYIDSNILPSESFSRPIMDILRDLVSQGGQEATTAEALGEWVLQCRHWNIRLKIGYASLYTETNLFMPAQDAAGVKMHYEERGLGRMNLFADEGANRVAVLYHAGAFDLQDLYYDGLFVGD